MSELLEGAGAVGVMSVFEEHSSHGKERQAEREKRFSERSL